MGNLITLKSVPFDDLSFGYLHLTSESKNDHTLTSICFEICGVRPSTERVQQKEKQRKKKRKKKIRIILRRKHKKEKEKKKRKEKNNKTKHHRNQPTSQ